MRSTLTFRHYRMDAITPRQVRGLHRKFLYKLVNLILWWGELHASFSAAWTVIIPKSMSIRDPGDVRPIPINNVL